MTNAETKEAREEKRKNQDALAKQIAQMFDGYALFEAMSILKSVEAELTNHTVVKLKYN